MNKKKVALDIVKSVFRFLFLAGLSVIIVYPFFYSLSVAVRDVQDLYDPLVILVPRHFTRENITNVMERMDYVDSLFGSFFRDGVSCLLQIASCPLTGYGLARFNFKGKKIVIHPRINKIVIGQLTLSFARIFSLLITVPPSYLRIPFGIQKLLQSLQRIQMHLHSGIQIVLHSYRFDKSNKKLILYSGMDHPLLMP